MTLLTHNPHSLPHGGTQQAANVTSQRLCCTLNTRYEDMATNDILSLRHFPKTVILITYD